MDCPVFSHVMGSQVWLPDRTQKRHKKTKFIIFTGPRKGVTACHEGSQGKS